MLRKLICGILIMCLCAGGACAQTVGLDILTAFSGVKRVEIEFDESYFSKDAREYNHMLMRATAVLTQAGMSGDDNYGDEGDYNRERYAFDAFRALNFTDARAYNFSAPLNDTSDKVAFSIARRELESGETLVFVIMRSGNYGAEWASNFYVGDGRTHAGFTRAAEGVVEGVTGYIREFCAGAPVKLWITGYSRGAAVANMAAARLNDMARAGELECAPRDIYAYTFATPATVREPGTIQAEDYSNIFNIICALDIVPGLPLAAWGYGRYGTTLVFADIDPALTDAQVRFALAPASEMHARLDGNALDIAELRALQTEVDETLHEMLTSVKSVDDYVSAWQMLFTGLSGLSSMKLNKRVLTEDEFTALCAPYEGQNWTRLARRLYDGLPETGWQSGSLLALLDVYGGEGALALSEASVLADMLPAQSDAMYEYVLTYMSLAMMNAKDMEARLGGNRFDYFSRSLVLSETFAGLINVFAGHMPELYISFLTTLSYEELFN